ncbi:uncharacterized protein LAESUDRAFT_658941 [Laetiporus sulphureus 93-53]|uniref:Uncharacterized protein n=1 Tax=Laetiporus sulphureus 93-53 TaxID=1314785 RepID=A0A165CYS7_9APHY|nr:uncharacterized protein LAESUDRAFT_658941 [Laetiporus sulphureus 93-53]KZT03768.1 hypothetical protein LAESUDRAFT_658941 [Laetiporus sulphureus 93-53]
MHRLSSTALSFKLARILQLHAIRRCVHHRGLISSASRRSPGEGTPGVAENVSLGIDSEKSANEKGKQKEGAEQVSITKQEESPVPLLQRPLGVRDRPTSQSKTWADIRDEILDHEKRLEKRKYLVKEATRGYFTDLNATRRHGGKTWIAPKVMIREDKALYFPDVAGSDLKSKADAHTTSLCVGKVSVVAILSSRISELQTANFVKPTLDQFANHPSFRFVQVNLQENLLKSLLVSMFISGIRKTIPERYWETYIISSQRMDYLREDIGMTNRHVAYVYLLDEQCRVRWAGCADPMAQEIEALRVCTGVLLKRYSAASNKP